MVAMVTLDCVKCQYKHLANTIEEVEHIKPTERGKHVRDLLR